MFLQCEIDEHQVESPDQFQTLLNGLFYNRISALKDFRKRKQQIIDDEAKRQVLESCASDIMFDYERLTENEKAIFDPKYGELVQEMMIQISMLPPKNAAKLCERDLPVENRYRVNYRVFDLEALCELRLSLSDFLQRRQ